MNNNKSQEKNLFDFKNEIENQIANVHTTSNRVLKMHTKTTLKMNSGHNKKMQELLQHIVQYEKSF